MSEGTRSAKRARRELAESDDDADPFSSAGPSSRPNEGIVPSANIDAENPASPQVALARLTTARQLALKLMDKARAAMDSANPHLATLSASSGRLESLQADMTELQKRNGVMQRADSEYKARLREQAAELDVLRANVERLEAGRSEDADKAREYRVTIRGLQREAEVNEEARRIAEEKATEAAASLEAGSTANQLEKRVWAEAIRKAEAKGEKAAQWKTKAGRLQTEVDGLKTQLTGCQQELADVRQECEALRAEIRAVQRVQVADGVRTRSAVVNGRTRPRRIGRRAGNDDAIGSMGESDAEYGAPRHHVNRRGGLFENFDNTGDDEVDTSDTDVDNVLEPTAPRRTAADGLGGPAYAARRRAVMNRKMKPRAATGRPVRRVVDSPSPSPSPSESEYGAPANPGSGPVLAEAKLEPETSTNAAQASQVTSAPIVQAANLEAVHVDIKPAVLGRVEVVGVSAQSGA